LDFNSKVIKSVQKGSIADEAGIEPGDTMLSINGKPLKDVFDYRFLTIDREIMLEIEKQNEEVWEIEIFKDEYEDLGIEFENPMMDKARGCTNKCIFCFIDQLPPGMRETLYFKDDDTRLSFLLGNYVTLTNITWDDIERIKIYKMSPINVSVHTTNSDLRVLMLKNRFAGDVMKKIKSLVEGGITVNCQIVLCRGINDGDELDKSLFDLSSLYPGVKSISVVPVGLTKYRDNLPEIEPYDKMSSLKVIEQVKKWQKKNKEKYGSSIVYLADEFYIMAEKPIPPYEHYEGFPQLENGVGMIALFINDFNKHMKRNLKFNAGQRAVSLVTGVAAYKFIKDLALELESRFEGLKVNVYEIKNEFFGENVTVTGLLTGQDIISQLTGCDLGDELLICSSMLKSGEDFFLDDYTIKDLEKILNVKVTPVRNTAKDFVKNILGTGKKSSDKKTGNKRNGN